ncbi:MAG TPA: hypothetical protein VKU94_01305 [Geobacterales bacterium]|nr:hypothetical protein [Geobacterales bacterium]
METDIEEIKRIIMRLRDVTGVGITKRNDKEIVLIFMRKNNPKTVNKIKKILKNEDFEIRVSGEIRALN